MVEAAHLYPSDFVTQASACSFTDPQKADAAEVACRQWWNQTDDKSSAGDDVDVVAGLPQWERPIGLHVSCPDVSTHASRRSPCFQLPDCRQSVQDDLRFRFPQRAYQDGFQTGVDRPRMAFAWHCHFDFNKHPMIDSESFLIRKNGLTALPKGV